MVSMKQRATEILSHVRGLSLDELKHQTDLLVGTELDLVVRLIAHISEVSLRRLHVKLGHPTLFQYCVNRLGLPEGCVWLKTQVSGCCRRHPQILDALIDRRLSLSVAGHLSRHLTEKNREHLIAECSGMTTREVKEYLVRLAPKKPVSSGVRESRCAQAAASTDTESSTTTDDPTVSEPSATTDDPTVSEPSATNDASTAPDATTTSRTDNDGDAAGSSSPRPRSSVEPCQHKLFNLRFAADRDFIDKVERAAYVVGLNQAFRNLAQLFERSLDTLLEKHDPELRQARRERKRQRAGSKRGTTESPAAEPAAAEPAAAEPAATATPSPVANGSPPAPERSRYIPEELRDRLLIRAGHRCEYRSVDGHRCTERTRLAIDHIVPFALRGTNDETNLRVLCHAHNRLHADRCLGAEFMTRKIESARSLCSNAPATAPPGSRNTEPAAEPTGPFPPPA